MLCQLLPWSLKRPIWLRNFIQEPPDALGELEQRQKTTFTPAINKLLALSLIGLFLQTFALFHPTFQAEKLFPAVSWAASFLIVIIWRPQITPKSLFIFYCSVVVSQIILLNETAFDLRPDDVPVLLGALTAFAAICVILNMPLRDPKLSHASIGAAVGGAPTPLLRTPEDNLTFWQYMSVSWMTSLIKMGNMRKLNDDDVWNLGYEFRHRLLSDKFKELQGSVLSRLLKANGLDLILVSTLFITSYFLSGSRIFTCF